MSVLENSNKQELIAKEELEEFEQCVHDGCHGRVMADDTFCPTCGLDKSGTLAVPDCAPSDGHVIGPHRDDGRPRYRRSGNVICNGGFEFAYPNEWTTSLTSQQQKQYANKLAYDHASSD